MKSRKSRKDGIYSINLSFTPEEVNLIDYVDSKGNFSSYIKRLIKQDMEKDKLNMSAELLKLLQEAITPIEPKEIEQKVEEDDDEVENSNLGYYI